MTDAHYADYDAIKPLILLQKHKDAGNSKYTLNASVINQVARVSLAHTVHQHAMHTLICEIVRHPPVFFKNKKYASIDLTPDWVHTCLHDGVVSICVSGFCAWRIVANKIVIAVPGTVSVVYNNGEWVCDMSDVSGNTELWNILMVNPPIRTANGGCLLNSSAYNALEDTDIYNEMYENIRRRDHFNSRPTVFTVVDKTLRNHNGSSKQWFQQQTSNSVAGSRINTIDSNFQTLVQNRATSIRRLEETSAVARERLNSTQTKLAGSNTSLEKRNTNMQHTEHMITDGKDIHASRSLMSLTDGFQMLNQTMYNIMFHFHVPPQVLGRNINAERTGVNPRLNEMVLQSFFTSTTRLRHQFQNMFSGVNVDGAIIQFQPTISPYELDILHDKIEPCELPKLYGMAYHVPASMFLTHAVAVNPTEVDKRNGGNSEPLLSSKRVRADEVEVRAKKQRET
tara:strand:+ start:15060 stop:16421 length:1362 start_codon:yes stop_codon:yes gene_type:complete